MFGGVRRASATFSSQCGPFWLATTPPCSGSAVFPGVGVQADTAPGAIGARRGDVSSRFTVEEGGMVNKQDKFSGINIALVDTY